MLILGIETSCDDTAVALVRNGKEVIISKTKCQTAVHAKFGGIIPEIAAREHLDNIAELYQEVLAEADIDEKLIDAIAVTQGPGLTGALLVGCSFAKGLSLRLKKPLIPVNHIYAHVHGAILGINTPLEFPSLALIVSGGHTSLYQVTGSTQFTFLSATRDDACGECFDKVAVMFGLPYPGGPAIEAAAKGGDPESYKMPLMMKKNKSDLSFSYSGLKTHMLYLRRKLPKQLPPKMLTDVMASFQKAALNQLVRKLKQAAELYPDTKSLLIAGGVACNQQLRQLTTKGNFQQPVYFPNIRYCTDNAAMVAAYAWYLFQKENNQERLYQYNWDVYAN